MAQIDKLFQIMADREASDLHLSSGSPPCLRIHGAIVRLEHHPLKSHDVHTLVFEILNDKQKRDFIERWELDCSYDLKSVGRFRCNIFMQNRGLGAAFRMIPNQVQSPEELRLTKQVTDLIETPRGLVLVTGPTGSGKSTTLASLIHIINTTKKKHIITIEDPIEFVHENLKSLINQREVNSHTKSFANALRSALREDPDIILVGEMRDLETIQLAMTAAETGHLVFGTLHTNSASKTIDRIIDVFPEKQQSQIRTMLSESLRGVVAQALIKRADQIGRIVAVEVLTNTHAVANLIREGKAFQIPSTMQTGVDHGMVTFEAALQGLINDGEILPEDAEQFLGKSLEKKINSMPNQQRGNQSMHTNTDPKIKASTSKKRHTNSETSNHRNHSSNNLLGNLGFGKKRSG